MVCSDDTARRVYLQSAHAVIPGQHSLESIERRSRHLTHELRRLLKVTVYALVAIGVPCRDGVVKRAGVNIEKRGQLLERIALYDTRILAHKGLVNLLLELWNGFSCGEVVRSLGDRSFCHNLLDKILVDDNIDVLLLCTGQTGQGPVLNAGLVHESDTLLIHKQGIRLIHAADGKSAFIEVPGEDGTAETDCLRMMKRRAKRTANHDGIATL